MPLLLLALAAVGFLVLRKQPAGASTHGASPVGGTTPSPGGGTSPGGLVPKTADAGKTLAIGGRNVSLDSIAKGIAVGVGIGAEIDKALGGTGTGVRGYVAQALGGVIGAIFICFGAAYAAVALFFAVVIYGVVVGFDDLGKVLWTDGGGPEREYKAQWAKFHDTLVQTLRTADPSASEKDVERFATHAADGYMLQTNRLAYTRAMNMAWGINVNRQMHAFWQLRHGYFWGGVWKETGDLDESSIARMGDRIAWVSSYVPAAEQVAIGNYVKSDAATQTRLTLAKGAYASGTDLQALVKFNADPANFETVYGDKKADLIRSAARAAANAGAYVNWMTGAWGVGQSEASHAAWGLAHGEFEGSIQAGPFDFEAPRGTSLCRCSGAGAALSFGGRLFYWQNTEGQVGVFAEAK